MSTKKMHPPAMVHASGPMVVSKGGTLMATTGGGKPTKDRQNVENIVPLFHPNGSNGNELQANGKKVSSKTSTTAQPAATGPAVAAAPAANAIKTVPPNLANGTSVISTLNSANRRKSNRHNSPNRKRREQQNIFNSLKAWNVKIVPSGQTAGQENFGLGEKESAGGGVSNSAGSGISISSEASKANSERSSSVSSTTTSGSVSSSVSSNTSSNSSSSISSSSNISDSTKDVNGLLKGKKRAVTTTSPAIVPASKEPIVTVAQNVKKKEEPSLPTEASSGEAKPSSNTPVIGGNASAHSNKGEKKLWTGGFSSNNRHPAATISSSHSSSAGTVIPSPSLPSSVSHSSQPSPVMSTSSPAVLTTSPTNHSRHTTRAGNAGKVLLPNVNPMSGSPMDPIAMLQGKLRNSVIGSPQQPHHIPHHHSTHSHLSGQGQQQQQQHHGQPQQQLTPVTSPHYSLDFLHYVGMRMSTANGTSQPVNTPSAAASALLRANPHFNYNHFNQQLQQQQLMHQHQQQQQQQQPFSHLPRHYQNFYNCDELLLQTTAMGDPMYTNFSVPDHMTGGVGGSGNASASTAAGTTGVNEPGMAYCYSQNHQHHNHQQQQHNHPTHQQHHPQQQQHHHHQQQQQQPYGHGGGFHHNNNYQQHNRNYGRAMQGGGGNYQNGGGKKPWHSNWANGKKIINGKYGNKNSGYNYGYRKGYNYYNNNHYGGGGGHHFDHNQNQQQSEALRNLIYIKGYNSGQRPPGSHDSTSRSPTPSPQSASPTIEATEASQTIIPTRSAHQDERSDSGIEEVGNKHKKSGAVPSSSSSSSSVVSIPSTESSTISASAAQNLSLELDCGNGPGYESDSSHSSSYKSNTYRHRKYANSGQVYRSSSSTSSGVSSTATFPPLTSDYCSMPSSSASANNTPTTMTTQMTDFFLRSQSYHGSHQNLMAVSASTSPNPPDSPTSTARPLIGTQSMPMFSELFTGKQYHQPPPSLQQKQQRSQPSSHYGSDNSLELALPTGIENSGAASTSSNNSNSSIASHGGSSGYGSALASTVPPNEVLSMQSGHPKKRYSGRTSPLPQAAFQKANRPPSVSIPSSAAASSQQSSAVASNRKVQQPAADGATSPVAPQPIAAAHVSLVASGPVMYPFDSINIHTPADRFLARAHLVELRSPPVELAPSGCSYGLLSTAIWDKFAAAQQTQEKYIQKIQLWKHLYTSIRMAFPRFSLYLVGSTISRFASDDSDVDMCLVCRTNAIPFDMRGEALFQLGQLKNYFMNISTYFEEFSVIQAKVPILRFRDTTNSIVVDLNYNNCVGIRNTHLLLLYSQMDWRLRPLALVVKLWAQHHNINDAKNMTISSYSLVLMVIHFLQYGVSPPVLPCLHALYPDKFVRMSDISTLDYMETVEPYKSDNTATLGELFVQFLEYYANFDYTHFAISVRTASVISIESARTARSYKNDPHHWRELCIEEPFDLTNTARAVFDADVFEQIKSVFSTCWRRLKDTNDLSTIFECEPLFIPVASALSLTS